MGSFIEKKLDELLKQSRAIPKEEAKKKKGAREKKPWEKKKPQTWGSTLIKQGYSELLWDPMDPFGVQKPRWIKINPKTLYPKHQIIKKRV